MSYFLTDVEMLSLSKMKILSKTNHYYNFAGFIDVVTVVQIEYINKCQSNEAP